MKKALLATAIVSLMGMSNAFAAEGDMVTVEVGDVSGPAVLSWAGNVTGVIEGDTFTLTGIGGTELIPGHALQVNETATEGTYDISSVKNVTIEAHNLVEGATPDTTEVGGLVGNPLGWDLSGFSVISSGEGVDDSTDLGVDKLTFNIATHTADGTVVSEPVEGAAPERVEGNHTIDLSFEANGVTGLLPGDEVVVGATVIATAIDVAPAS